MDLSTLCQRLDSRLRTADFTDIDPSANGLQIGPTAVGTGADRPIDHVAFAVDAAREPIDRAIAIGADLLVVHHGLSWGGMERLTGQTYDRVAHLIGTDTALYVSHLPLDAHRELGNAAGLARTIGLRHRDPFGDAGGEPIGVLGEFDDQSPAGLGPTLEGSLDTGTGTVTHLNFGPERIETMAIVTGSGGDYFSEAVDAGVDAFLTGEAPARIYHQAREAGIHVYLAGHYATETFGVRALADLLDDWVDETTFIDAPTGL